VEVISQKVNSGSILGALKEMCQWVYGTFMVASTSCNIWAENDEKKSFSSAENLTGQRAKCRAD
jgi:hypothetical protein